MPDLYMDRTTGDLDLTANTPRLTATQQEEVEQAVLIALRTRLGEWAYDIEDGVDWFGRILGRYRPAIIEAEFRRVILSAHRHIVGIRAFSLEIDRVNRHLTVRADVVATESVVSVSFEASA